MSAIRLHTLLDGIVDQPLGADAERVVSGIKLDSRQVQAGDIFVALQGMHQHGLDHAADVIQRGAIVILSDRPATPSLAIPVYVLPELRSALGTILSRWHPMDADALCLIGVTGTNGKTSTVQLLAEALTQSGLCAGSIGTLGSGLHGALIAGERTTPDVIATHAAIAQMRSAGATHIAMEVSSHALDQQRVAGLSFRVAAFTNLTHDHLDYHGSMDAYGAAKARLFDWPGLSAAVINIDDAMGAQLQHQSHAARIITVSVHADTQADIHAESIRIDASGIGFELCHGVDRFVIQSALLGRFNVANLLLVAGVLLALDWPMQQIATQLNTLQPVAGRMNRLGGTQQQALIIIDYAHTPDALEKALQTAREHTRGNLICVFGCGGERDREKRPLMAAIAERLADIVIVTDDNPRAENGDAIVAEIVHGFTQPERAQVTRDRRAAIRHAIALARPADTVLIAGKGHEPYQEIAGVRHSFDDYFEARTALEAAA